MKKNPDRLKLLKKLLKKNKLPVEHYKGVLEIWFDEPMTEGIVWTLKKDGEEGYNAQKVIRADDYLKVYGEGGKIIFEGFINPDYKIGWQKYPHNPDRGQPGALNHRIHWTQKGWQPDDWAKLFMRERGEPLLRAELLQIKMRLTNKEMMKIKRRAKKWVLKNRQ